MLPTLECRTFKMRMLLQFPQQICHQVLLPNKEFPPLSQIPNLATTLPWTQRPHWVELMHQKLEKSWKSSPQWKDTPHIHLLRRMSEYHLLSPGLLHLKANHCWPRHPGLTKRSFDICYNIYLYLYYIYVLAIE